MEGVGRVARTVRVGRIRPRGAGGRPLPQQMAWRTSQLAGAVRARRGGGAACGALALRHASSAVPLRVDLTTPRPPPFRRYSERTAAPGPRGLRLVLGSRNVLQQPLTPSASRPSNRCRDRRGLRGGTINRQELVSTKPGQLHRTEDGVDAALGEVVRHERCDVRPVDVSELVVVMPPFGKASAIGLPVHVLKNVFAEGGRTLTGSALRGDRRRLSGLLR